MTSKSYEIFGRYTISASSWMRQKLNALQNDVEEKGNDIKKFFF